VWQTAPNFFAIDSVSSVEPESKITISSATDLTAERHASILWASLKVIMATESDSMAAFESKEKDLILVSVKYRGFCEVGFLSGLF
jgi:hypothetical protein